MKRETCDGQFLKWLLSASVSWLDYNHEHVNQMNVFPVPDGDTGTNMLLTMQKAYHQIADMDDKHVGNILDAVAQGALMGARGNSGTILSMLLRGLADELRQHETFDALAFARAARYAADYTYDTVQTVMKPVEGTIITVARDAGEAVLQAAEQERDLKRILEIMVEAARHSLDNTPNLLPRLKEAQVVDSGGMGYLLIIEGMLKLLRNEKVVFDAAATDDVISSPLHNGSWQQALEPSDEEGYGYDVQFLMMGDSLDVQQVRTDISAMGWSPLVAGDEKMIKVHVHVQDPGQPLSYAISQGAELDDLVVENMQLQYQRYVKDRLAREEAPQPVEGVGIITVVRGDGLRSLCTELQAAHVVEGGQTMNPSIEDFLTAIDQVHSDEIIILPNNKNILIAAQQAAGIAQNKHVRVLPTRTIPQGISALLAYDAQLDLDALFDQMSEMITHVVSCEVTRAVRDTSIDGIDVQTGRFIGLLDGKLIVSDADLDHVVRELLCRGHAEDHELVTLYYGEDVDLQHAQSLASKLAADDRFDTLEFEVVAGGQPLYPYIISVE